MEIVYQMVEKLNWKYYLAKFLRGTEVNSNIHVDVNKNGVITPRLQSNGTKKIPETKTRK